jgi:mannosyltransferase
MSKQVRLWLMTGVVLLAFGLRVWLLADTNLNWDEGYSAWISDLPLTALFDTTARDVHPPLYYLVLRLHTWVLGDGEFGLRFGSVWVGVLLVVLTYRLGRAVGGDAVGVVAALLVALARAHVHISQLARMHSLAALLATLALWATIRLWQQPTDRRALVGYVVGTAGALYSFYLALVLPLAVNLAFVMMWVWRWRDWRRLWLWTGAQFVAAGLFAPWAWYASQRMFGWNSDEATSPLFFVQFYASTLTVGRPTFDAIQLPYVAAYLLVIVAGVGVLVWQDRADRLGAHLGLLIVGVLTPAVVVFLLSLPFHNLGRPLAARYMLPLSACFYVLAAWGIVAFGRWRRLAGAAALLLTVTVAVWGLSNIAYGAIRRDDMHSVALALEALRHPGDAVVLHNDKTWTTLAAHYDEGFFQVPQAVPITPDYSDTFLNPIRSDHPGIWLITTANASVNDPSGNLESSLRRGSLLSRQWTFNDHTLSFYTYTTERSADFLHLAPGAQIPTRYAAPQIGLAGAERPLYRYPLGDSVNLALYWSVPPVTHYTLSFVPTHTTDSVISHTILPPDRITGAMTRQQVTLPLTPDTPAGAYRLRLSVGGRDHDLGTFWVVRFHELATVTASDIDTPLDVRLRPANATEPIIRLHGYTLHQQNVPAGGKLDVTLYWEAIQPLTTRYKISVFLLGDTFNPATNSPLFAQVDAEPLNWTLPTPLWAPGEPFADPYSLPIAPDVPPGEYTLGVVMYTPTNGARLSTMTGEDVIGLQTVRVR